MINIENLTKAYGSQLLLDGVNLKINSRERVGIIGRNGHGKTTLFRLIKGIEHPDDGVITIPRHYRIGYVLQHLDFTEDTILKEGMLGLPEEEREHFWKVEKILGGLGFSTTDMQRHPSEFSGGYQVRLNLAKELVSEPNLLLLDEPTNYLDITSIRWIERFLCSWPNELMLITHDRSFMDKIVTHTAAIHRMKIRKIAGNTEKLYSQIAQDEEVYEKTRVNDERKRREVELFITRFRAKARLASMVQSRIKALERTEKKDKLNKIKNLDFSFQSCSFNAKQVMSVNDLSFSYDPQNQLINNFNISIGARDRICIIGRNGKGKTTLLRLLAGEILPDKGVINEHPNTRKGLFEQTNIKTLVDKKTVEEEVLHSQPGMDRQIARNICGAMMFEGDDALKKISVLSGGEKSRVMLGKLLATPSNLLLLDEPTNHLDMESCDALLAALDNFEGAVVIVTHNEMFLHALAERLIIFQKGNVSVFEGSYHRFIESVGWDEEGEISRSNDALSSSEIQSVKPNKKEARRIRSEIISERSAVLKPLDERISDIENEICLKEKELEELNHAIVEASQAHEGKKIENLSRSIHGCRTKIDRLFEELDELTCRFEKHSAVFEKRLNELEEIM